MDRGFLLGIAGIAAVAAAVALPAAPTSKAAAKKDWTRNIVATPEGGFRIGNPQAKLKIIEYGSLTCEHCARFAQQGMPVILARYVKGGGASFEFRNFVRDPADMAGALLSRCGGTSAFFKLTDRYFASQQQWLDRVQATSEAQQQQLSALPPTQAFARLAAIAGLDAIAAKAGMPPAKAKQCLTSQAGLDKLVEMNRVATTQHQLKGTPTFILNGKTTQAYDWPALQPLLGPPGG